VEGLLRLARKAGTIVVGVALTKDNVRAGRVRAVWIADDLLAKRSQSLIDGWRANGIAIYRGWTKDELGDLAGKAAVAVLSVTDPNIAAGISQIVAAAESDERERQGGEQS
jgi:ribosomal protein L7Ae-like RNA K-turn-binding protein